MRTRGLIYAGLLALLLTSRASAIQDQGDGLDPRIGAASEQLYRTIRDGKDWKNPYLVVRTDSVDIRTGEVQPLRQNVKLEDLRAALIKLPVQSWPYGRVVAVSDQSLIRSEADLPVIAANHKAVRATLIALNVIPDDWP